MIYPSLLRNIDLSDTTGTKFLIIQQWLQQACINAGYPTMSSDPLLRNIDLSDTEGTKWAILQRWITNLANGLAGGAAGAGAIQSSQQAVTTGTSSLAVVFATPFGAVPSVICNLVPPNGGALIAVAPINVTLNGFTATWGFAVPANYSLSWVATKTTQ